MQILSMHFSVNVIFINKIIPATELAGYFKCKVVT